MTEPGFVRSHCPTDNDKRKSHVDMFQPLIYHVINGVNGCIIFTTREELNQYNWRVGSIRLRDTYSQVSTPRGMMWKRNDSKPLTLQELQNLHPIDA